MYNASDNMLLPDDTLFESWEQEIEFRKTYYVDCNSVNADDNGPGSEEYPFRTIGRAGEVLQPGERAVIFGGVYRETIKPLRGGGGPDSIISYEAGEGARVIVKGSVLLKDGWTESDGWDDKPERKNALKQCAIWQIKLDGKIFEGYNPFAMYNLPQEKTWLDFKSVDITPFFRKQGMLFVDGKLMDQADRYIDLYSRPGCWIEHDGLTIHVRLENDEDPAAHNVEITVKEHVFRPFDRYLGYIRLKGITFEQCGNGFPVPQRGIVSTNRGHHWLIENCTIQWANSVGIDLGNEHWNASKANIQGCHIIRNCEVRFCGICGIASCGADNVLVERNIIEECGWQNAEGMAESAAIKFHFAKNCLIRRNIIRRIRHSCGIWLDFSNVNSRIAGNILTDITTVNGAILIEASHCRNLVDNNVIIGIKCVTRESSNGKIGGIGVFSYGSDKLSCVHNLITDCEGAGFYASKVVQRMVEGRGGTARDARILNNIFGRCGRAAIELPNRYNLCEGNIYFDMPDGFLRIGTTDNPYDAKNLLCQEEILDLEMWRSLYGWDLKGNMADMDVRFDQDSMSVAICNDRGEGAEKYIAGPFDSISPDNICIDPRLEC